MWNVHVHKLHNRRFVKSLYVAFRYLRVQFPKSLKRDFKFSNSGGQIKPWLWHCFSATSGLPRNDFYGHPHSYQLKLEGIKKIFMAMSLFLLIRFHPSFSVFMFPDYPGQSVAMSTLPDRIIIQVVAE